MSGVWCLVSFNSDSPVLFPIIFHTTFGPLWPRRARAFRAKNNQRHSLPVIHLAILTPLLGSRPFASTPHIFSFRCHRSGRACTRWRGSASSRRYTGGRVLPFLDGRGVLSVAQTQRGKHHHRRRLDARSAEVRFAVRGAGRKLLAFKLFWLRSFSLVVSCSRCVCCRAGRTGW